MENSKKIVLNLFALFAFFTTSCKNTQSNNSSLSDNSSVKSDSAINCSNSPKHYLKTDNVLIFRSKKNNDLYLKRSRVIEKDLFGSELSKCEKIPFLFLKDLEMKDKTIKPLGKVIDLKTFKKIDNQFYKDSLSFYVFQSSPARYPNIVQLNLNNENTTILKLSYIKDSSSVFWKSIKMDKAQPKTFKCIKLKTKDNSDLFLAMDDNNLYYFDKLMSKERFENMPLLKHDKERLYRKYYK